MEAIKSKIYSSKNKKKNFSIIIPVYNVEKYLARCLDSCVNQNMPKDEYEIIIVNDGSPDGSKAIAEQYVEKYSNIKLINQENGGLSVARNNGLKVAQGKYVWFVDSDDWIAENCLPDIVRKMESENLDMLQIGYYKAYDNGEVRECDRGQFDGCMSGCEAMRKVLFPNPAQFAIYRRNFLLNNNLMFYPGIFHEDAEFKPRVLYFAKRFSSFNSHLYYYYQRDEGSIMSHYNIKRGRDIITVCNNLVNFEQSSLMELSIKKEFDYIISTYINELFRGIEKLEIREKRELLNQLKKSQKLITSLKNSKSMAHRFEGFLLSVNVPIGIGIIKIINILR